MSENAKPGILRNLRIKRVSIVDIGANLDTKTGDGAHIMLYKRHIDKGGPDVGSVHVDSTDWREDYEKATIDSESRNKLPDSSFAAVWTDSKGVKQRKLPIHDAGHLAAARGRIAQADIPADVKAAAQRKIDAATNNKEKNVKKSILSQILGLFSETDVEKRAAAAEKLAKSVEEGEDVTKVAHDPDNKDCKCADCTDAKMDKRFEGVSAEVKKSILSIEKKQAADIEILKSANAALVESIAVEKKAREVGEMTTVLKSLKFVPIKMDTDVAKYIALKNSSPESWDAVLSTLKSADEQLSKSALYKNFGSGHSGGKGDAWAEIEALAEKTIEKSEGKMTHEAAIEKVTMDPKNMELMKRYRAEQQ